MAREAALRKDEEWEYQRDTIDSKRREEADNYQFPPTAANDNGPRVSSKRPNIKNVRTVSSSRRPRKIPKPKVTPPVVKPGLKRSLFTWRIFGLVVGATSIVYSVQFFFGIVCLIGMGILAGIEADWVLSAINFGTFGAASEAGGALLIVGMAGAFVCGFVNFLIATIMYSAFDKSILHGFSLLVLTLCMASLLVPVINILPVMILWYLYMALAK